MGGLVKIVNKTASFTITTLAMAGLLMIITTCSVSCESVSNTPTLHGNCDEVYASMIYRVNCSSYTEIPTDISHPGYVTELHMEKGNVFEILKNGSIIRAKLTRLETLSLQHCKIRIVESGVFDGHDSLKIIDLSNNLITSLNPDMFKTLWRLVDLRVANNPINIIESAFPSLLSLDILNLGNCKLETISTNVFDNLWRLKSLNLSGNHFIRMDTKLFDKQKHLTFLGLEGNPWHCDCHVKYLMETLKHMHLARGFENVTCASAEVSKWQGYIWSHVPDEDMTCHPQITKFVYSSWSPLSHVYENVDSIGVNESLQLGQEVYFECKFEGFPKPKVQWLKDNKPIKTNINGSTILPANRVYAQPKVEILDDESSNPIEQVAKKFDWTFREILVLRRIQMADKGIYSCVVSTKHMTVHKEVTLLQINIPCKHDGDSDLTFWKGIAIASLSLAVLIVSILVFAVMKSRKRDNRGTIKDPSIHLGGVGLRTTNAISVLEDTVTSLI